MRPCQTTSTSRTLVSWKRGSTLHERVPFRTTTTRKFHHLHHHHHHHHAFLHGGGRYRRVACDELVCLLPNDDDDQAMSIVLRVHVHVHGLGSRKKRSSFNIWVPGKGLRKAPEASHNYALRGASTQRKSRVVLVFPFPRASSRLLPFAALQPFL